MPGPQIGKLAGIVLIALLAFLVAASPPSAAVRSQALNVDMPDLSPMRVLRMSDESFCLYQRSNADFDLSASADAWTGTASFRVDADSPWNQLVLEAQVPITVPLEAMQQFRAALEAAPLVEQLPEPTGTAMPDVYTSFEIDISAPSGQLAKIYSNTSTFSRWRRSPWVVEFDDQQAFTTDNSVDRAMAAIAEHLSYETFDRLIEQAENPSLLTPSPVPVGRNYLPVLLRRH
jgi:hypothetical protein